MLEIIHLRCIPTFSDSSLRQPAGGRNSIPTHVLGHWTREREAFTLEEAVRKLTSMPAAMWGFHDQGLVRRPRRRPGHLRPRHDRPGHAVGGPGPRWRHPAGAEGQRHQGDRGQRSEEFVDRGRRARRAYPGQVLRGPLARR
ncbi:MAG: hypothetical protein R2749_06740 [Acidimicrobiales bacterium]